MGNASGGLVRLAATVVEQFGIVIGAVYRDGQQWIHSTFGSNFSALCNFPIDIRANAPTPAGVHAPRRDCPRLWRFLQPVFRILESQGD